MESKKKHTLIFETYIGRIRNLKSKQFSGPLKKIDIATLETVNNLSDKNFCFLKNFLYQLGNTQINKYQFVVKNENIVNFKDENKLSCFYYRDKNTPMYLVEDVQIRIFDTSCEEPCMIQGIQYSYNKNVLAFNLYPDIKNPVKSIHICPVFYIDIETIPYKAKLFFEYDKMEIDYSDKNICGNILLRDYFFEQKIVNIIKNNGWKYKSDGTFEYCGKSAYDFAAELQKNDIILYTNQKKRISTGKAVNISVSYDMDWFHIKGSLNIDGKTYSLSDLIDFRSKFHHWVELGNNVVIVPPVIEDFRNIMSKEGENVRIEKQYLGQMLYIADEFGVSDIKNIENLLNYEEIVPQIDQKIFVRLREYQRTGVKWLLYLYENHFGGCLADDMGLGKTFQVIAYLSDKRFSESRNLIVAPKTLLINWKKEFEKFAPDLKVYVYHGTQRSVEEALNSAIVITSYGITINDLDKLVSVKYDNVIIDEAQNIKNNKSNAYKALRQINARSKILMTGTPLENHVGEYWNLMRISNPNIFPSLNKIAKQGEDEKKMLQKIKCMTSPFVLRRVKTEVLHHLPEKQEQTVYCKMDTLQENLYYHILKSIQYEIKRKPDRFEIKSSAIILNGLQYLQQVCCHPKLLPRELNMEHCIQSAKTEVLMDMLKSMDHAGHKVVVFSRFTKMLRIIEGLLAEEKIRYFYLDGQTKKRMEVVDDFEKSEKGIFLISLKAGGTGLNLVSADTAVIYDPWWNPAVEKQAEDRIYRIGQEKNVMIYRLIVEGSIEEKVEELKLKKSDVAGQILKDEDHVENIRIEVLRKFILDDTSNILGGESDGKKEKK